MRRRLAALLFVLAMSVAGSASATLLDRGPDLVYDDILNITWTRSANLPGAFRLRWNEANTWAADLVFAGFDDWRLPWASVSERTSNMYACTGLGGADEVACRDNELAYMYYYDLGGRGLPHDPKINDQTAPGGEVLTGLLGPYWAGAEDRDPDSITGPGFRFRFCVGAQFCEVFGQSAWAVRDGDVIAAVPEPDSLAILALGLIVLGISRMQLRS